MKITNNLADEVITLHDRWSTDLQQQRSAIFSFAGDIYSGLQIHSWSSGDLDYAQQQLRIVSGLYGVLRPLDGIMPYRLEMGYRLPDEPYKNLYKYWGDSIANALPTTDIIIDLTAKEYSKAVLPHLTATVNSPKFMTISPKTGQPTFVVVHAKIARGAFAAWLIKQRVTNTAALNDFNELGYAYNKELSSEYEPVFICKSFGGIGLSVRGAHKN